MKPERFKRTKSVMASSAIALVVAALVIGASSLIFGPRSASSVNPGFDLAAGSSSFTITSNIYSSPACSGSTAPLYPGTPRCLVFTVKNNLSVPIIVQSLSTSVTSPPAGCPAGDFSLPTFSGTLRVGASGTVSTSGLPISLVNTGTNQDACQGATISFTYTGNAEFTDTTSTTIAVSPTSPTSGQPTTLSATVAGNNASSDPSLPTGNVTFNSCPTSACSSSSVLGTGSVSAAGVATLTTSSLTTGVHYLQAVYGGEGTDYSGSTSPVLTPTVGAPITSGATPGSGSGSGAGSSSKSSSPAVAFTGADIAGMVALAVLMIGLGTALVVVVRRRRRVSES